MVIIPPQQHGGSLSFALGTELQARMVIISFRLYGELLATGEIIHRGDYSLGLIFRTSRA